MGKRMKTEDAVQAECKRIADQINLMTYEAILRYGDVINLDRYDDNPAIDAALNMARVLRMTMDRVENKGGRPVEIDACKLAIVRLRDEAGMTYGEIAKKLIRLNNEWGKNGKPYSYNQVLKWYQATKKNLGKQ